MIRPGTDEEAIYRRLLPAMSRAGRAVDCERCGQLAVAIQARGHRDPVVRRLARLLGLNPRFIPRPRDGSR